MPNIFDSLFNLASKPIRRNLQIRLTQDAQGNQTIEAVAGEAIQLSSDSSIDQITITPDRFLHCGCSANTNVIGGRCGEKDCHNVSCVKCFSRCCSCFKPLCLEHLQHLKTETGVTHWCKQCLTEFIRLQLLRKIGKGLVSPFVEFEDKKSS